jgi:acylphosphatase
MTTESGRRAVLLRIHGRVQGVAFRAAMRREAQALGLGGWARNRADGTVEACVCGAPADVDRMLAWASRGPAMARVDRVVCEPMEVPLLAHEFEIRPSL